MEVTSAVARLPTDILVAVFAYLPLASRIRHAALVCKRWSRAARLSVTALPSLSGARVDAALRTCPFVTSLAALPLSVSSVPTRLLALEFTERRSSPAVLAMLTQASAHLTRLDLGTHSAAAAAILASCGTTLQRLKVHLTDSVAVMLAETLPALPSLRRLTLLYTMYHDPKWLHVQRWVASVWGQLTRFKGQDIARAHSRPYQTWSHTSAALVKLTLASVDVPMLLPLAPSVTLLHVTCTDDFAALHHALASARGDPHSLALHVTQDQRASGLALLAPYLTSLETFFVRRSDFATLVYSRLTRLTLHLCDEPFSLPPVSHLPALTHLTAVLYAAPLVQNIADLRSILANLGQVKHLNLVGVTANAPAARNMIADFVRSVRDRYVTFRMRLHVDGVLAEFLQEPDLLPYLLQTRL